MTTACAFRYVCYGLRIIAAAGFAMTGTAGTVSGTGSSIRTADALYALLLFLTDIKNRRAQDQYNKGKNEEVLHSEITSSVRSPLPASCLHWRTDK